MAQKIYQHNLKLIYISEFFRSLIFIVPMWTAFELKYITFAELAIVDMVIAGSQIVLELPTGAFADLVGKRISVVFGLIISAISMFVFALSDSFTDFLLYAVLLGLGESFISGSLEALNYDSLKQDGKTSLFDKVVTKINFIFQIGIVIATLVGGFVSEIYIRLPIAMYGLVLLVSAAVAFFYIEPKVDSEKFTLSNYLKQTRVGFRELFRNSYISKLSFFYAIVAGFSWSLNVFFSKTLMVEQGMEIYKMGILFSVIRVANSLVLYWFAHNDRLNNKRTIFILFAILLPLSFLPVYFGGFWLSIFAVIIGLFLSTARFGLLGKYTNAEFTSKNRSTAISTLNMMVSFIYIFTLFVSMLTAEKFGGSKFIISLMGVLMLLLASPIGLNLARTEKS